MIGLHRAAKESTLKFTAVIGLIINSISVFTTLKNKTCVLVKLYLRNIFLQLGKCFKLTLIINIKAFYAFYIHFILLLEYRKLLELKKDKYQNTKWRQRKKLKLKQISNILLKSISLSALVHKCLLCVWNYGIFNECSVLCLWYESRTCNKYFLFDLFPWDCFIRNVCD